MISLLLTRKLLNQESMVVQFKSSLQRFHSRHHGLVNIRDICVTYDPGYAPFVIITFRYFLIQGLSPGVYKSNTTGTTKGAGTACPPGGNPLFLVRVARCFCVVFCNCLCFFFWTWYYMFFLDLPHECYSRNGSC